MRKVPGSKPRIGRSFHSGTAAAGEKHYELVVDTGAYQESDHAVGKRRGSGGDKTHLRSKISHSGD
jgi:hypothetical protein